MKSTKDVFDDEYDLIDLEPYKSGKKIMMTGIEIAHITSKMAK